ncbi:glycosyltransferase family 4 protein [Candidatus Sumerlaeota bacterium]|nr:glycosyltransferase family 4 protein [Candidatus Sumerlaeota bacterium]
MRIGVDARYLSSSPGGIGRRSRALLEAMFNQEPDAEWVVLAHQSFPLGWPENPPPNLEIHRLPQRPVSRFTLSGLGEWIEEQRLDLWHAHFPLAPRCHIPLVVTVHDLQPLLCPGWTGRRIWPLPWAYRAFYRRAYESSIRRARRVIAVSEWTAQTIREQWPEASAKITVIPAALESRWLDVPPDPQPDPRVPAVLYVGSTRPNKNLPVLIQAFAHLICMEGVAANLRLRLVVVRDRFWPPLERRIRARGLRDRVDVIDPLGDLELAREYRGASALAFVTTHEGFGFPPLEAMACGCPVIASRHGALPETCSDAAEYVDHTDPMDVARGLARVLTDAVHREGLIRAGRERAARRRWAEAAEETLSLYRRVLGVTGKNHPTES